jgi:hypothetical protein
MAPRPGRRATRTQSKLALACRSDHPDAGLLAEMRRQLDVDRIADHIEDVVAKWPALTAEQLTDLSVIIGNIPSETSLLSDPAQSA